MSTYKYKHEHLVQLLEEAGSLGNLAANLGLSKTTVRRLYKDESVWPHESTEKKMEPFVRGRRKIKQLKRPYVKDR